MRKLVESLLPLAVGVAVFGAAIWYLVSRGMGLGLWLLAALLIGHGLIHAMFAMPRPGKPPAEGALKWPFDMADSWLVTRAGLGLRPVRTIGFALAGVVVAGFVYAGLASVGVMVPVTAWRSGVIVSAAASVALLALFFNPQLVIGLGIDAALLWIVVGVAWAPVGA